LLFDLKLVVNKSVYKFLTGNELPLPDSIETAVNMPPIKVAKVVQSKKAPPPKDEELQDIEDKPNSNTGKITSVVMAKPKLEDIEEEPLPDDEEQSAKPEAKSASVPKIMSDPAKEVSEEFDDEEQPVIETPPQKVQPKLDQLKQKQLTKQPPKPTKRDDDGILKYN
jgi:hypothetical protein